MPQDLNSSHPGPARQNVPIGIDASGSREEFDSLGTIEVPAGHYWGAQTQRSLKHFAIGSELMPTQIHRAYGHIKRAAALVNARLGVLPSWKAEVIAAVAAEIVAGKLDDEFPLYLFQTGSGTHTNMNVNEVIANRAIQLLGGKLGSQDPIRPNDDVNMSQSTNDTFPTAMHLAAYQVTTEQTIPALRRLRDALAAKAELWADVVKLGRTHLQDATPLTVGQEWSGYVGALDAAIEDLVYTTDGLRIVAMGGTAVGTGLNAPPGFAEAVAVELSADTGFEIRTAENKFTAHGTLDRLVRAHASLKTTAVSLFKIANDLRWLGSGPRAGLAELIFPANEPGSSIMPGKVNPSQAEAMLMVCTQVMGADVTVAMAGAEGNFELNAFRPVVISNYLTSATNLADACNGLRSYLIEGTELNTKSIQRHLAQSVMMVTALAPTIGYQQASAIAHHAIEQDLNLRDAALALGVSAEVFDELVDPLAMTRSH
jgi:fumarate hydratase class II